MQMFLMVDYVREMIVKKACKCGRYGLFEHLLFFSFFFFLLYYFYFVNVLLWISINIRRVWHDK